jgi:hypothetical protein
LSHDKPANRVIRQRPRNFEESFTPGDSESFAWLKFGLEIEGASSANGLKHFGRFIRLRGGNNEDFSQPKVLGNLSRGLYALQNVEAQGDGDQS